LPASFSSLTLLVQPVTAAGLGWLAFAESLGPWRLAGGAAVLLGVVLARTGQNAKHPSG
jgi:drug/metabolite transporter (DMT)-like permease